MLALLLVACNRPDTPVPDAPAIPTYTDPDGNTVTVGDDGTLHFGDRTVSIALGEVATPDPSVNYDPMNLGTDDEPAGFHWRAATGATWNGAGDATADGTDDGAGSAEGTWTITFASDWTATLVIDDTGPGLRVTVTPDGDTWAPYIGLTVPVASDEAFYGLGEWFDGAEHRGHVHPMHIRVALDLESSYNEAHAPVPLLISTAGWGLLADSFWPGKFDVAATDPDAVQVAFEQDGGFSFDVYGAPRPADVLARYAQRAGLPEIPPDWAFAPLEWHDESTTDEVLASAAAIRANGIPGGCVWIDNPWQTTYNSMVPDEAGRYPDWDGMIATLQAQGFRMLTWTTPYVEDADPEQGLYADNGWLVDLTIEFNQFGPLVDLTNAAAAAAWKARIDAASARGVDGWKLDYGEDVQVGLGPARLATAFANGQDERTMHHQFVKAYHGVYAGDDGENFLLGRAGVLGGQTITDAIWPGDLDSDFRVFGEDGHVGGLPSAVRAGTGLAASGYPFFASDTGGYRHDRPTEEVFLRWTEYAALLPIFQYGGSGADHDPWNFTPDGGSVFTAATLDAFRNYAVLHTRLFPYFKSLAERAAATGLPIVQARGFAYPEEGLHPNDVFLVGDDLLVDVVEAAGVTEKEVALPAGGWVHWWTGARYSGTVTVPAPLGAGLLFQREDSAIPLLRPTVMTLAATDGSVDSWADDPGRLYARVVGNGSFTLPSGEAMAWSAGTATLTAGTLYTGWDIEVWAPSGLTGATADGVALPEGDEGCTNCWISGAPFPRVMVDEASTLTVTMAR